MIYPGLGELVAKVLERKKVIILCTNGMFIRKKLGDFKPSSTFFFNVHLDGMRKNHDIAVEREGVFDSAIDGIKAAKEGGFLVCTNTTIFKETDMAEIDTLFAYLTTLDVDGFIISPAYSYAAVNSKEIFMTRDDIKAKFREAEKLLKKHRMMSSPIYLEFLSGKRELTCTAWGNPTYNTKGWKGPCYLITDAHHATFRDLIDHTDWDSYGAGNDARCDHCMVHSGFEASAALGVNGRLGDSLKMLMWQLT
jgi:hopanoid biosynthesis associated radical SAM protein HpnH